MVICVLSTLTEKETRPQWKIFVLQAIIWNCNGVLCELKFKKLAIWEIKFFESQR